jgi:nuclease-like protein
VNPSIEEMGIGVAISAGLGLLFSAPLLFLLWKSGRLRRQYQRATDQPFTELPLRPPGESVRLRIEALVENQQGELFGFLLAAITGVILVTTAPVPSREMMFFLAVGFVLINTLRAAPKVMRGQRKLWEHRLGFMGERLVGQELNRLLALGYQVFHDVPCESYFIDHVIVGQTGVFAVETQTRRKPPTESKTADFRVRYDGDSIFWPDRKDSGPIDQAVFNSRSLAHWLSCSTGQPVKVQPIVTLPGWTVEDTDKHRVWAANPTQIKEYVERTAQNPLEPMQVERIAKCLAQRCRLKRD